MTEKKGLERTSGTRQSLAARGQSEIEGIANRGLGADLQAIAEDGSKIKSVTNDAMAAKQPTQKKRSWFARHQKFVIAVIVAAITTIGAIAVKLIEVYGPGPTASP